MRTHMSLSIFLFVQACIEGTMIVVFYKASLSLVRGQKYGAFNSGNYNVLYQPRQGSARKI